MKWGICIRCGNWCDEIYNGFAQHRDCPNKETATYKRWKKARTKPFPPDPYENRCKCKNCRGV